MMNNFSRRTYHLDFIIVIKSDLVLFPRRVFTSTPLDVLENNYNVPMIPGVEATPSGSRIL